jgi:dTDP-4-dehydrorhamnose 3,5-epimerase
MINFDETVARAIKDVQTTVKDGTRTEGSIDGVLTNKPINHVDHRGRLFEIWNGTEDFWKDPVVYAYMFSIAHNTSKGWGLHLEKKDRYTLISGECITILYDPRLDSPTYGMIQKVTLTPQGTRQLVIPTGVWHMNVNISTDETFLINHPTQVYHHEAPDRYLLDWNTKDIPFDVSSVFPKNYASSCQ